MERDASDERDPLDLLADEFALRCRKGERPSVSDYAATHPTYAESIRQLFPTIGLMEQLRLKENADCRAAIRRTNSARPPEHLGDFDIVQEIGRGGMGIVYEAEQRSLGRRVAVKVLPKHALLCESDVGRFEREARTAARLHHTNIVPVFGVGEQDGLHYYVMPLVRGVGLDEILVELRSARGGGSRDLLATLRALVTKKFGPRPSAASAGEPEATSQAAELCDRRDHFRAAARIGLGAAEALAHAHAHGTLHRDIKPSNLLIDEEGAVYVADFGLARAMDHADLSRSGDAVGTVRYMAPEQFLGRADARSDLYSLGLTLYELATLQPPFADRREAPGGRYGQAEPVRPRKIRPDIPRDLETIVLKCLAHEPAGRYATAAALAADLRAFLEDRPIAARRIRRADRAWRWCRRNPALAGVSALSGVLLIAVVVTAAAGYRETRTAYSEAKVALNRAEATSLVSLAVLENIYLQLSPDRVGIASAEAGSAACACIGLGSGDTSCPADQRAAVHVQASRETAMLLEHLLVFYDRLAEQASNDSRVALQSAIASRRVGDIRQRLGQTEQGEREYERAVRKLLALPRQQSITATVATELARCHNEIGNVRSARLDHTAALAAHEEALAVLESFEQTAVPPAVFRYELARTLYLLSSRRPNAAEGLGRREPAGETDPWPQHDAGSEQRKRAVGILEELVREDSGVPDYRFLLALCHRPPGIAPVPARGPASGEGRHRAIRILEKLKAEYPAVADYRYELTTTYAWVPVGLFPWQGQFAAVPAVEENLLKALDESQWLVVQSPTIPHYATSQALILAKLGTICWAMHRLPEAEEYFQRALDRQSTCVAEFPDLPCHNRVLTEFFRLRLAQVRCERNEPEAMPQCEAMLKTCVESLSELAANPELAEDRLARTSLPVAQAALKRVRARAGKGVEITRSSPAARTTAAAPPSPSGS